MKNGAKTRQELEDDERVAEAIAESSSVQYRTRGKAEPRHAPGDFMRPDELKWTAMGGEKIMNREEEKTSSFGYLLGGFVVGAVCGLLFAPKKGSELIEDIGDWGRDTREKGRELYSRAKDYIPHRVKRSAAEAVSAAREAGEQAYRGIKDKADEYGS
jgi:gas vesicle protein